MLRTGTLLALLISAAGCATLCNMLAPRTVRSSWFRDDDGVMTKPVDQDATYVDSVDLTDELEEHQSIVPSWAETNGVTLGAPTAASGIVTFTHHGVGTAILQAVTNYIDYLASLGIQEDAAGGYALYLAGGALLSGGEVAGTSVFAAILDALAAPVSGLDGKFLALRVWGDPATVPTTTTLTPIGVLAWDAVEGMYAVTLVEDLPASTDGTADRCFLFDSEADARAFIAAEATCAALPTLTHRIPLRFVDPSNPTQDYTP